ncbi:MAG: phosphopantetheine adenylyltransferase [Candidatus Bathyarchaeota archaeon]|nr:phosphopantetheine adenylyltransferase [Candidatus Bathyarchaeota archaeon]MCX8177472.1 phosphopantetheine adenylyltransferase [Candidatus Bathyarchaeota archaeon]MDW8194139.1 phosphopantetheine adenylyltransferase [Nitrososphaerota archaeon]
MQKKFNVVAVGGTFDELHKGHRKLLMKAFEVGEHVLIGLCTDEFVKQMNKPHMTASYMERLKELKEFLAKHGFTDRARIIPLNDPYGVTLSGGCVEAIVVSRETERTAIKINEERLKRGFPPLSIITIDMVPAENHIPISTTRIRRGEIDREGHIIGKHVERGSV